MNLLTQLLDLLYPARCLVCNKSGAVVHDKCRQSLPYVQEPFCHTCSRPLEPNSKCTGTFCRIPEAQRSLTGIRSVFWHTGGGREAAIKLKYRGVSSLRDWAALEAYNALARWRLQQEFNFVVAVPLHPDRLKQRGYNQAGIVAEVLARRLNVPYRGAELARVRATRSQVELDGQQRAGNVKNAFSWQGQAIPELKVLVVDDVCTTGATLNECAAALKLAGASEVWALTLTREMLKPKEPKTNLPQNPSQKQ